MNLYDFDNTIFKGDSSIKFIKYSLIRHPLIVSNSLIKAFLVVITHGNLTKVKDKLFSFVAKINNIDEYLNKFILKNMKNIKKFYLEQKEDSDVIISASPRFLIEPFCNLLGIKNVIATEYDIKKGKIIGNNCKGEEKVKRFHKLYKDSKVNKAYSDSYSDIPMLNLAKEAYIVKGENLILYENNR